MTDRAGEPIGDDTIPVEANDFETTCAALRDAIAGAGPLTLVRELDHSMNAARHGIEGQDELLGRVAGALAGLADTAASAGDGG